MRNQRSILALIPARGGSKGLPRKNIRLLAGKPLIAWTIEAALKSECFDSVIVNTDDPEIASIASQYGAEVPFLRPPELATDEAKSIEMILHTMNWFESRGRCFDLLALLQPTSPLRSSSDIQAALDLLAEKRAGSVVSVCKCEHSPLWMNTLGDDLSMKDFLSRQAVNVNRQELKPFYRLNGAIYIAEWEYLKENNGFFGERTYAYIMPQERSVDIDSELDLRFAGLLLDYTHFQNR